MNLLDAVIVLAAVAYGFGGFRNGAVLGIFSTVGFFAGAVVGAQVARPIGEAVASGRAQIPIAIVSVLLLAMLGQLAGVWVAGHIRSRVVLGQGGRAVDAGVGCGLGVLSVLLVAWMIALPLRVSPYPTLASEATHSSIVGAVDDVMPNDVRTLYGSLRSFLDRSGFPPVFGDYNDAPIVPVAPPPSLSPAVRRNVLAQQPKVFKIYGTANQCDRRIEGSGFVYAPNHIMTNAHVVAGTDSVTVEVPGRREPVRATVVLFDKDTDVAVLYVPRLGVQPIPFAARPAAQGAPGVVLGYPEDGPYTIRTARVRSTITVDNSDIYRQGHSRREIYAIFSMVRSGNSGGPMLTGDGRSVLGVVFATAATDPNTGFVLTDKAVRPDADRGATLTQGVSTMGCTPEQ
ncbi:MAG: MarP family serine protease [Jatrophihabitans sp.]|uniref:MarP family serine protease n=1 Tax=Jatrophihabitans sp. TaxID=1932789 RepID=UPI003F81CD37